MATIQEQEAIAREIIGRSQTDEISTARQVMASFDSGQGGGGQQQVAPAQPTDQQSALSLAERVVFSFGDDPGKEEFLKGKFKHVQKLPNGKFAVGDDPKNLSPVDPEGVFNDMLGDVADMAGLVPVITGQIIGATTGFLGTGGIGTVAGGAGGAALGQGVSTAIGRSLGVRKGKAEEEATDIAIAGAFGAVGEGIGKALKFAGKGLSQLAKNSLDRGIARSADPSKTVGTLSKMFKLTAAVDVDNTIVAGAYGFNNALGPKYMNEAYSRTLMTQFAKGLILKNKALGRMVGSGDAWAVRNFGNKVVESQAAGVKLLNVLKSDRVGIVDSAGRLNKGAFSEAKDFNTIKNITDSFFTKNPKTGQLIPKSLNVRQSIDLKKKAQTSLSKYFKSEGKDPLVERSLAQYLSEVNAGIANSTLPTGITLNTVAKEALSNNRYINANKAFAQWKNDLKLLKSNGLDIEDVGELKELFRGGKIVFQKLESFFERFKTKNSSAQEAFAEVADKLPVKFNGGGIGGTLGTLTDELKKYNAAQGFSNANPNFLRMTSLAAMVGLNLGRDDPKSAAITGGIGLLFGTPAGARVLLRGGEKVLKGTTRGVVESIKKSGAKVPAGLHRALLSRLLAAVPQDQQQTQV